MKQRFTLFLALALVASVYPTESESGSDVNDSLLQEETLSSLLIISAHSNGGKGSARSDESYEFEPDFQQIEMFMNFSRVPRVAKRQLSFLSTLLKLASQECTFSLDFSIGKMPGSTLSESNFKREVSNRRLRLSISLLLELADLSGLPKDHPLACSAKVVPLLVTCTNGLTAATDALGGFVLQNAQQYVANCSEKFANDYVNAFNEVHTTLSAQIDDITGHVLRSNFNATAATRSEQHHDAGATLNYLVRVCTASEREILNPAHTFKLDLTDGQLREQRAGVADLVLKYIRAPCVRLDAGLEASLEKLHALDAIRKLSASIQLQYEKGGSLAELKQDSVVKQRLAEWRRFSSVCHEKPIISLVMETYELLGL